MARQTRMKAEDIPQVDLEGYDERGHSVNAFGGDADLLNDPPVDDRGDDVSDEDLDDGVDSPEPDGDPVADLDDVPADPEVETPPSDTPTEAEDDPADEAEGKDAPDKKDDPQEKQVEKPRSRMQERLQKEIEKRKEMEAELTRLRSQQQDAPPPPAKPEKVALFNPDEIKAAQDALLDGEGDKFAEFLSNVLSRQEQNLRNELTHETQQLTQAEVQAAQVNHQLQVVADEIGREYPQLDTRSAQAEPALIEETIALRDFYASRGADYPTALREAAATVAYKYNLGDDSIIEPPPVETKAPQQRKPVNVDKKLEMAQRERGRLQGDGDRNRDPGIDLRKMTDEQFEKLSAEKLAELRGDNL